GTPPMLCTATRKAWSGLLGITALFFLLCSLATVQAQPGFPPNPPRPPFMPPGGFPPNPPMPGNPFGVNNNPVGFPPHVPGHMFETVWTCGKCGREVGRGGMAPGSCPYCGVKFINGFGPSNVGPNGGGMPPTNPPNGMVPPGTNPPNGMVPPGGNN